MGENKKTTPKPAPVPAPAPPSRPTVTLPVREGETPAPRLVPPLREAGR